MPVLRTVILCVCAALYMARPVEADVLYADATLVADITDGTYSIAKRGPGGRDGDAYKTIQAAVEIMEPGDTLLLRGGTFNETNIRLVKKGGSRCIAGSPERWLTIRSFPGEWAVVDGGHREQSDGGELKAYSVFSASGSRSNAVAYWRFEYFEVTGGGPSIHDPSGRPRTYDDIQSTSGKGFHFWPGSNLVFDHMYIHGNYGGGGPNGGCGISIQNESGGAQGIRVRHCWLRDNGWRGSNHGNLANITLFADYAWPHFPDIDTDHALSNNEIEYNLLEDSAQGFRHKGTQYLSLNHMGSDMHASDRGDQIHHNIIHNCHQGIQVKMDFAQVYNNIVIDCPEGIGVGSPPSNGYRELFHVLVYNNTIAGASSAISSWKGWEETAYNYLNGPFHPHFYMLNNIIFDDNVNISPDSAPVRIDAQYGGKTVNVDTRTLHLQNTLFVGRTLADPTIRLGTDNVSLAQAVRQGWARPVWAVPASKARTLFTGKSGIEQYLPRNDAKLGDALLANAGRGGDHPYLKDVKIPGYVGAVDPEDAAWVADVANLRELGKSIKAPLTTR